MSLLTERMTNCVRINRIVVNDGYGGEVVEWHEGSNFSAAIVENSSMEARIAEQQGVTSLYTVTTSRLINLQYHDVFKRLKDGKIFRVTSDGDDNYTPKSASLDMRNVSAEEWVLNGQITGD